MAPRTDVLVASIYAHVRERMPAGAERCVGHIISSHDLMYIFYGYVPQSSDGEYRGGLELTRFMMFVESDDYKKTEEIVLRDRPADLRVDIRVCAASTAGDADVVRAFANTIERMRLDVHIYIMHVVDVSRIFDITTTSIDYNAVAEPELVMTMPHSDIGNNYGLFNREKILYGLKLIRADAKAITSRGYREVIINEVLHAQDRERDHADASYSVALTFEVSNAGSEMFTNPSVKKALASASASDVFGVIFFHVTSQTIAVAWSIEMRNLFTKTYRYTIFTILQEIDALFANGVIHADLHLGNITAYGEIDDGTHHYERIRGCIIDYSRSLVNYAHKNFASASAALRASPAQLASMCAHELMPLFEILMTRADADTYARNKSLLMKYPFAAFAICNAYDIFVFGRTLRNYVNNANIIVQTSINQMGTLLIADAREYVLEEFDKLSRDGESYHCAESCAQKWIPTIWKYLCIKQI